MNSAPTLPRMPARSQLRFGPLALMTVAIASAAAATGAALIAAHPHRSLHAAATPAADTIFYQCPMHPSVIQDHPGKCPICGMTLVERKKADLVRESSAAPPVAGLTTVAIDAERQQLIGLRTSEVTRGPIGGAWRTVGRVAIDETRVKRINVKVPAFVEKVYVDFVGKRVRRGDPLFSIYSPELLAAQEEYLLALDTSAALSRPGGGAAADGDVLVSAARRRLGLWDVPEAEVERLTRSRQTSKTLTFRSPVSGVVTRKDVVEGMKLDAGAMPYEVVDLSSVWVLVDVYEAELPLVAKGMTGTLTLNAFPGRAFEGRVAFVDPLLDPQTRTAKARLAFGNAKGELRPEMFGEVVLRTARHEALRIPADAVIDSGTEKVVFVAMGEGKFQPRRVQLGAGDGSAVEVLDGLVARERVVIRASFLVDSESRLRASLAAMSGNGH